MIFWLADRWGEPDPSKIAALPADTLFHWRAFFLKQGIFKKPSSEGSDNNPPLVKSPATANQSLDEQCAAVMKVLM
ncbi:hypothetical protein ZM01_003882 [Salmonella enterica subsp. enterica serovar Oranienburg]|nr:hypothetical protein [Salmonella enterica]EBY0127040.1 hypothetical protein [Salmonella enterica subsp. enterica serovar Vitkin]EBY4132397.1 hypothetical protein [Salmonella enterica subsp. enterica serovar Oranienburg]ECC1694929.1 hypothetical protein [Salmonella enterica subsp. salamae]ECC2867216.1 hypothetical protein [Salmonella enterica subsp. enterica]ECL7394903.1 hypothetical protein [Salmonella enterica subsp. enterica serovar Typhimurium]EDR0193550.1 hypothetical protein [Salmonel